MDLEVLAAHYGRDTTYLVRETPIRIRCGVEGCTERGLKSVIRPR